MNRYVFLALILALLGGGLVAHAQQPIPQAPPDPAFLQKVAPVLQAQRNAEADQRAIAEARAAMLQDEVAKLQKELMEARTRREDKSAGDK
jgi:hypothetical protein